MRFLKSKTTNPYFNIATEEYLLKNFNHDFFFLYINEPSIIVGKHQNTMAEINVPFTIENNLKVVRRLSGGGTVFHDAGNLNYCFIQNGKEGFLVDFKKYTQPILNTLQNIGVNAYLRGKSDLVIDDLKFSGNAEHVYRKKILHHGTLLFDSELSKLNEAIKTDWSKFDDKAVRSTRSKVTNICSHLKSPLGIKQFRDKVFEEVQSNNTDFEEYILTESDFIEIEKLIANKYQTWDWNFGYSPKYKLAQSIDIDGKILSSKIEIDKGVIVRAKLLINNTENNVLNSLSTLLINEKHAHESLFSLVDGFLKQFPEVQFTTKNIIQALF